MKKLAKKSGITLLTLVITVVILLIIIGITASMGIENIEETIEDKYKAELGMVQTSVLQQYYKYTLTNSEEYLVGTEVSAGEMESIANELEIILPEISGIGKEYNYYRLNTEDLKNIGIRDSKDNYIVNYATGVVINDTVRITGTGYVLYIMATDSASGYTMKIPDGFTASKVNGETNIKDGLVIIGPDESEFVWVPVPNPVLDVQGMDDTAINNAINAEISAGRYPMAIKVNSTDYKAVLYIFLEVGNSAIVIPRPYSSTEIYDYREPDVVPSYDDDSSNYTNAGILGITNAIEFKTQLQNEYNQMVESVIGKGGFYIGRYETSLDVDDVQSKKNITPMAMFDWYTMYQKQKLYVDNNNIIGMTSEMIWGSQWDQVMIWMKDLQNQNASNKPYIIDSTGMGRYSDNGGGPSINTGTLAVTKVKNIYDMAGNAHDWTMEAVYDNERVRRGGVYYYSGSYLPANSRFSTIPTSNSSEAGSRLVLY